MKKFGAVTVFGWKVPVFKVEGLEAQGLFGFYDQEKKFIAINDKLSEKEVMQTLIHEMFHACFDRLHIAPQLDEKFVEVIVENLTIAVTENFKIERS